MSTPQRSTVLVASELEAAAEAAQADAYVGSARIEQPARRVPLFSVGTEQVAEWLTDPVRETYPGFVQGPPGTNGGPGDEDIQLDPDAGPTRGGRRVEATGTGLLGVFEVLIGGLPVTELDVASDTLLTFLTPALPEGSYDVEFQSPGETVVLDDGFTVLPKADIDTIQPDAGPVAGGTEVTLTGTGFEGVFEVLFDGEAGTDFVKVSDTQVRATTPAHAAGPVAVQASSNGGSGAHLKGFTYVEAPIVAAIDPTEGPEAGGTTVTITGTNLGVP